MLGARGFGSLHAVEPCWGAHELCAAAGLSLAWAYTANLNLAFPRLPLSSTQIEFPNPNEAARLDILKIHSRKMNLTRGIDLKKIADKMSGGWLWPGAS
jgi:hypothetical protein